MKRVSIIEHFQIPLRCVVIALAGLASSAVLLACDTPVYRYAMYRWQPADYEVYHFYTGEIDDEFTAVAGQLADASKQPVSPANVTVYSVNLEEDPDLKTVRRDVRRQWKEKVEQGAEAPSALIVNPFGYEVYFGQLQEQQITTLFDSPARQQLGQLLSKGHAGIFVLMTGKSQQLNKSALAATERLVADVNSGKIKLYSGPEDYDPLKPDSDSSQGNPKTEPANSEDASDSNDNDSEQPNGGSQAEVETFDLSGLGADRADDKPSDEHSVAMLSLNGEEFRKSDPWFYRSLMAAESDLHQFQDEPMLFVVYGRGRALPPYIGKGISYDNLVEITDFITGACSCTVKEQNPGVDLLMAYDWEAASAAVADRFGTEEGNEESLADLFPQLIVPTTEDEAETQDENSQPKDVTEPAPEGPSTAGTETQPADDSGVASRTQNNHVNGEDGPQSTADNAQGTTKVALPSIDDVNVDDPEVVAGMSLMATLGVGIGVALVALLAATFIILKPKY